MEAKLVVTNGINAGESIALNGQEILLGRSDECSIRPTGREISRKHCKFTVNENSVFLEDFGSLNGTWVNGTRIKERIALMDGDRITVGMIDFGFFVNPDKIPENDMPMVHINGEASRNTTEKSYLRIFSQKSSEGSKQ